MKKFILLILLSLAFSNLNFCMQSNSRGFLELPQDIQKVIMLNAINNGLSSPSFASTCKAFQQYMSDDKFKRDVTYPLIYRMADMHEKQKIASYFGVEEEQVYKMYMQNTNTLINLGHKPGANLSASELQQVKQLLIAGADCHAYPDNGPSIFLAAAFLNRHTLLKTLLAHAAQVNKKHNPFQEALMAASMAPSRVYYNKTVKILLRAGADINTQNVVGYTAIMFTVQKKSGLHAVKTLVKAGADITLRNFQGKTAHDIAHEQSKVSHEICDLVYNYEDTYRLNPGKYSCTIV